MIYQFYHYNDPQRPVGADRWHFVYLHAEAERHMDKVQHENDWENEAPDLFCCIDPAPTRGIHFFRLYGKLGVVHIIHYEGFGIRGRAALFGDVEGMTHMMQYEDWG